MPHIKVKPFNIDELNRIKEIEFVGENIKGNNLAIYNENGNILLLNIIKRGNEYLIKQNRVYQNEDIEFVKSVLNKIAATLNLEVLHSNTNVKPTKPKIAHKYLKTIDDFYNFTSDFKKIAVEIGFGSGKHLLYQASKNKDTLYIGVEIHIPSINQVLKQITLNNYNNIYIINYDGRLLLEMLQSNILDKIYVHFPVPWDKKPHRRVINKRFLEQAMRALKVGGELELRTDSDNYYEYSLELFKNVKDSKLEVVKNSELEVVSKYEARWRRMNKNIYTLTLTNLKESSKIDYNIDYNLNNLSINDKIPTKTLKMEDYFVHFGEVYKQDEKIAIECSFGSFDANEKKIIYVNKNEARYLPKPPAKSIANFKAHQLIREVLNGKRN